jgi:hypothetical protein
MAQGMCGAAAMLPASAPAATPLLLLLLLFCWLTDAQQLRFYGESHLE